MLARQSPYWCSLINIKHSSNTSVYRVRDNTKNWGCCLVSFHRHTYTHDRLGTQAIQDASTPTTTNSLQSQVPWSFFNSMRDASVCDVKSANNHRQPSFVFNGLSQCEQIRWFICLWFSESVTKQQSIGVNGNELKCLQYTHGWHSIPKKWQITENLLCENVLFDCDTALTHNCCICENCIEPNMEQRQNYHFDATWKTSNYIVQSTAASM